MLVYSFAAVLRGWPDNLIQSLILGSLTQRDVVSGVNPWLDSYGHRTARLKFRAIRHHVPLKDIISLKL